MCLHTVSKSFIVRMRGSDTGKPRMTRKEKKEMKMRKLLDKYQEVRIDEEHNRNGTIKRLRLTLDRMRNSLKIRKITTE